MLEWIYSVWQSVFGTGGSQQAAPATKPAVAPDDVDDPDEHIRAMVAAAFNHGGMVTGEVGQDGKLVITTHQKDGDQDGEKGASCSG